MAVVLFHFMEMVIGNYSKLFIGHGWLAVDFFFCLTPIQEMTPKEIRALRTREKVSQTVFAAYLNVTPSLVSKWDRGKSNRRKRL